MDAQQFCYWLQGYFELQDKPGLNDTTFTKKQVLEIKNHLDLVFKKVTPRIDRDLIPEDKNNGIICWKGNNYVDTHLVDSKNKIHDNTIFCEALSKQGFIRDVNTGIGYQQTYNPSVNILSDEC